MQTVGFPKLITSENSVLFFLPSGGSCPRGKIFSCSISSFSNQPCLVLTRKGCFKCLKKAFGRDMFSICETQKCWKYFPHVWKTKQNEAHSKTSEFILVRNNMKNTTVESVQLELNRNCFITWTRTQQRSQIFLAELLRFCEYESRTSCGLSPVTRQDPWAIWTFSGNVEGPVIPTKVWLIVLH